jgi:drug/metabolite transporter (DMT)-like permease
MSQPVAVPAPSAPSSPLLAAMPAAFVLLWSTGFIAAKAGLPHAEPFTFLLLRFIAVATILAAIAVARGLPWPTDRGEIVRTGLAGALIHGCYLGGVFQAIAFGVPAGIAALIVGVQPLLTAAFAGRYLGERVRARQWLGLVLGFAGVALVVANKLTLSAADAAGVACALAALGGMTAGTLYQKRHLTRMNLITGSAVQFAAVAVLYLPLALVFETMAVAWTGAFVAALAWLSVVLSIGAISLFHLLIRRGAAARVTSLFYLVPSVTALIAFALFDERLSALAIAGMVVAAGGVALATRA